MQYSMAHHRTCQLILHQQPEKKSGILPDRIMTIRFTKALCYFI